MTLEEQILHDWPADSEVAKICLRLWQGLRQIGVLDHYTFYDLQELAATSPSPDLAKALLYLSTPSLSVLRPSLLYESISGNIQELPNEEIDHYIQGSILIHPELGTPLHAAEVLVSFVPGERLHELEARSSKRKGKRA